MLYLFFWVVVFLRETHNAKFFFFHRFSFPKESSTDNSDAWNISIDVTWIRNDSQDICQFDGLERTSPSSKLYYPFSINDGLSYACSAEQYNTYAQANASSPGQCSENGTAVYLSYVLLNKLQVRLLFMHTNNVLLWMGYDCTNVFNVLLWAQCSCTSLCYRCSHILLSPAPLLLPTIVRATSRPPLGWACLPWRYSFWYSTCRSFRSSLLRPSTSLKTLGGIV